MLCVGMQVVEWQSLTKLKATALRNVWLESIMLQMVQWMAQADPSRVLALHPVRMAPYCTVTQDGARATHCADCSPRAADLRQGAGGDDIHGDVRPVLQ